ncbi:polysaccharide biosynthesis protein [Paraburkholderia caffeinilytica]|uniref:hypothetical protein n=1 Tax=Paraburkholderia caffeinilytica TaxID=1761016 RepID=UPI0038BA651F
MIARRLASNAFANLVTGVSATVFQIGLTAIATRSFGSKGFPIWALAMSLAALVPLFSANLSTVVTRRLLERSSTDEIVVVQAARRYAKHLSCAAIVVILAISTMLHGWSVPLRNVGLPTFVSLVALLVAGQMWQIMLQPGFGRYFARERNWNVALTTIFARVGALAGMGFLCWMISGRPELAAASLTLGACVGLYLVHRILNSNESLEEAPPEAMRAECTAMKPFLKAFIVWSISAAAIQYGLPAIMSILSPNDFSAFYLAYTLNLVVVGTVAAAASALLAPLGRKQLAGHWDSLERWMMFAPLATGLLLLVFLTIVWYALPVLLRVWSAGVSPPDQVRHALFWLALQTIARSMTMVYSVLLSSAGRPIQLSRPVILELGLSCSVALFAGFAFGETAFLAALAVTGLVTAIYTVWITVNLEVCASIARIRLVGIFLLSQILTLGSWILVTR